VRITDQKAIKNSEKELIDTITGDLDWGAIERLFKEKYNITLKDDIDYKEGDIVIHNSQIAYLLNFEVKVGFSVLFDRKGECLEVEALTDAGKKADEAEGGDASVGSDIAEAGEASVPASAQPQGAAESVVNENVSKMASHLADMISEINKD
jgi:hypothetical protein